MPPSNAQDFDMHLERGLRDLRDLQDDLAVDIMLFYSAANIPAAGKEKDFVHPNRIRDDLQKEGFKV